MPVILPSETKQGLSYLTDPDVRKSAGINSSNDYVFASQGKLISLYKAVDLGRIKHHLHRSA